MFRAVLRPDVPRFFGMDSGRRDPLSGDRRQSFPTVLERTPTVMVLVVRRGAVYGTPLVLRDDRCDRNVAPEAP